MSKYKFRPLVKGYAVFAYGEHVGNVEKNRHWVHGEMIDAGWRPSNEHTTLPTARTRQAAAEALWDAHNQRIREGRY